MITQKRSRYIFLDADDTLWENERYFREAKHKFALLLSSYAGEQEIMDIFDSYQEINIPVFGYGTKTCLTGFLDTAAEVCGESIPCNIYHELKEIAKGILTHDIILIDGVEETLKALSGKYELVVATKGDIKEQESKFRRSGLAGYCRGFEVMHNKDERNYSELAQKYGVAPEEILMVGNSVRSDIAPVINLGGMAIHIPHYPVWEHEIMEMPVSDRVIEMENIRNMQKILL